MIPGFITTATHILPYEPDSRLELDLVLGLLLQDLYTQIPQLLSESDILSLFSLGTSLDISFHLFKQRMNIPFHQPRRSNLHEPPPSSRRRQER